MLHVKFQDHRTSGSGEEDFLRFLPYMGMTANLALIGQVVSEKNMFENNGYIQVYSPGGGADNPLGSIIQSI